MNGKFWLAVLIATVLGFFGGWLVWGIALAGYYESNATEAAKALHRAEEDFVMWAMIVGQVAWSVLLVWIIDKTGSRTPAQGATAGFILGALVAIGMDFFFYSMMDMYTGLGVIAVDVVVNGVFTAIIGAAVGWFLGRGRAEVAVAT